MIFDLFPVKLSCGPMAHPLTGGKDFEKCHAAYRRGQSRAGGCNRFSPEMNWRWARRRLLSRAGASSIA